MISAWPSVERSQVRFQVPLHPCFDFSALCVALTTVSDKHGWDTSTERCFFAFLRVSSPSQCCLSHLTHQIFCTNIGRARRQ